MQRGPFRHGLPGAALVDIAAPAPRCTTDHRELPAAAWVRLRRGGRRGRPRRPGRTRGGRGRGARSAEAHRGPARFQVADAGATRAALHGDYGQRPLGGRVDHAGRRRSAQRAPGLARCAATGHRGTGAAPGVRSHRRLPRAGPGCAAARHRRRRSTLRGDRGGVHRRESDARSGDGAVARGRSPLWFRQAQGLRDTRSPRCPGRFGYSDVHRRSFRPRAL